MISKAKGCEFPYPIDIQKYFSRFSPKSQVVFRILLSSFFKAFKWFRYGFLIFFLAMFGNMVFQTYLVASGSENLREAIKLFWTFRIPWGWTYSGSIFPDWVAQFSFGFYSLMLTSLLIGLIVMIFFKPRTWCAFCPMGTMTQAICKLRNRKRGK